MSKTRIILVDDHTVLRAGLRLLINAQDDMEVVAEVDRSCDILPAVEKYRPDLLVLDLSLPDGASLPLISKVAALDFRTQVLILTMHDDPAYVRAALGAGAKGYLVKTVGEHELIEAIRTVHRGRMVIDLDNEALNASIFSSRMAQPSHAAAAGKLSEREEEVLRLLGKGISNQEIAQRLELSPKTVSTYRARIAEKLGLRTTADFVRYASDMGAGRTKQE
ncbi:MAG: response regulator transcription factor [Planctomycetaceae bacterium]